MMREFLWEWGRELAIIFGIVVGVCSACVLAYYLYQFFGSLVILGVVIGGLILLLSALSALEDVKERRMERDRSWIDRELRGVFRGRPDAD
jgi:hypothetical protein